MTAAIRLQNQDPNMRVLLSVMTETVEMPPLWDGFQRISGPHEARLAPADAAGRVARSGTGAREGTRPIRTGGRWRDDHCS
jgi:hypothetical protein